MDSRRISNNYHLSKDNVTFQIITTCRKTTKLFKYLISNWKLERSRSLSRSGNWKFVSGFTLVEFLTGFAIFGLVTVLVASLYFAYFKLFSSQNTLVDLSSQNKLVLDDITNQIRESQGVAATCCGSDTTSATVLILQLWPLDGTSEPFQPAGNAYDFVVFRQDPSDSTKLIKKVVPDAGSTRAAKTSILSTTVTSLNFAYDNADPTLSGEVTTSVTNSKTTYGKTHTTNQSTSAVLRNK